MWRNAARPGPARPGSARLGVDLMTVFLYSIHQVCRIDKPGADHHGYRDSPVATVRAVPLRHWCADGDPPDRARMTTRSTPSSTRTLPPSPLSTLRVAKTYAPEQNGAKRFAKRYGSQLVCVRHRLDATGTMRHTTVELLIESTPVASRTRSLVALRIPATDKPTRRLLIACGAQWRSRQNYWLLPRLVAKNLRLLRRVVPIQA